MARKRASDNPVMITTFCDWDDKGICKKCGLSDAGFKGLKQACTAVAQPAYEKSHLKEDIIEALESYGITREWWEEWLFLHDWPPTCYCPAREEWLKDFAEAQPDGKELGMKIIRWLNRGAVE